MRNAIRHALQHGTLRMHSFCELIKIKYIEKSQYLDFSTGSVVFLRNIWTLWIWNESGISSIGSQACAFSFRDSFFHIICQYKLCFIHNCSTTILLIVVQWDILAPIKRLNKGKFNSCSLLNVILNWYERANCHLSRSVVSFMAFFCDTE